MTVSRCSDIVRIQQNVLRRIGLWPEENPSFRYILKGVISFSALIILAITMLVEVIYDLNDFAKLSEILYIMITIYAHISKQIYIVVQRKTFTRMIKLLDDPYFSSYPEDLDILMINRSRLCLSLSNFFRYLTLVCSVLMSISPFLDGQPLPFPFPYDLGKYRFLMYIFQAVTITAGAWSHPCIDTLATSLIGIAATQLEILGNKIVRATSKNSSYKSLQEEDHNFSAVKSLKDCIRHHFTIIEYIGCIDRVFSVCVLVQFLGSVIIISNTLFHFVVIRIGSGQFFMLINYLLFAISQLFMYCWFGNEVILMSEKIRDSCYCSNWHKYKNDYSKYVFIIMERSKRPLKITVFKFSILSLNSFTTILRWSYSYFALLFKLYKKQP